MNYTALQTELSDRGFSYLSATRLGQYINRANHWISEYAPWPWLETSTSGTAPVTISDLREVMWAADTTNLAKLAPIDLEVLRGWDPALTTTGTPTWYYLDGATSLKVYPLNTTATINVRYIKITADLSSGADTPTLPARYHNSIVDEAVVMAYEDSDNLAAAQALQARVDQDMARMVDVNLGRSLDGPQAMSASYSDL